MKLIILLLSAGLSLGLNSCKTSNKVNSEEINSANSSTLELEKENNDLAMGEVQKSIPLKSIIGKKIFWIQTLYTNKTNDTPNNHSAYLIFREKSQLEVQSICNKGAGQFSLTEKSISININMMTRIACKDATIEYHFFKDLNNSKKAYQIGNKIFIILKENVGTMEFEVSN